MNRYSGDDYVEAGMKEQGKWIRVLLLLLLCGWLGGCARQSITLRILDQETRKPIEGAVAIAWYYNAYGLPGLTHHATGDVAERKSDADGYLTFPMFWTSVVPHVKVYKYRYVGWDNFYVYKGFYPGYITMAREVRRKGFQYKSQDILLEPWKCKYSHISHESFLITIFPDDHQDIDAFKSIFLHNFHYYEDKFLNKEREYIRLTRDGYQVKSPVCEKQQKGDQ